MATPKAHTTLERAEIHEEICTYLPSLVNIGGSLLADESVSDVQDHAPVVSLTASAST